MLINIADLMRRFDFEHWPRPGPNDVKYCFWRLAIGPALLTNYQLVRTQEVSLAPDCRYATSMWLPPDGVGLVRVDVYDYASRQAAELGLLALLDTFPVPPTRADANLNYSRYRSGTDPIGSRVWTRGNLTCFLTNADRKLVSLSEVATDLDRLFSTNAARENAALAPVLRYGIPANVRVKTAVPLTLEADYALPCWFRIDTKLGEVYREDAQLFYEAAATGVETMYITAIGSDGNEAHAKATITVT